MGPLAYTLAGLMMYGGAELAKQSLWPATPAVAQSKNQAELAFVHVNDLRQLKTELAKAQQAGQPVLLDFYADRDDASKGMHPVLRDVAAALGDKARVIKIDVEKNEALAEALRVKGLPTLMIYKNGEMKWRQSGEQDANTLIGLVKEYV